MVREPNYEMVILARQSRGFSQAQLAGMLGITPGMLSKIEHGFSQLTDQRASDLAEQLHYPKSLFYRPEHVRGSDSICFHHRKRKTMPARKLDTIEAEMHLAQLQVKGLLRDLDIETVSEFSTLDPDEHGGPTGVARILRAAWHVPTGPISNMVRLVESAGAVVLVRDFETRKLDGMSCWAKGVPPLFFLNSEMPTAPLRWTIAHEIGHLVMHWTPPQGDPEEEADEFARELLLPEDETRADLRQLTFKRLPQLKAYWRVSMFALVKTAAARNALPPNKIKSLYVQMSRLGWRTDEPYDFDPEEPTIAREAINVHLNQHGYSMDELASIADLEADDFRAIYAPPEPKVGLRAV
jgi:Zn-dependent peptidase ImmA (M78 family)/transcriptional regulator with XRE-family HTH domain